MDKTLEELKAEADVLGVSYSPNIGASKLSDKIEAYYTNQAAGDSVKVQAEVKEDEPVVKATGSKGETEAQRVIRKRKEVMDAKTAAFKTRVVTVSNNDTRENGVITADYFGFENQHFGKSLLVPFNVPVELPQGIIEVIKSTPMTIHTDEIIGGRRTGNKVATQARKYNISYEDVK
jgi:hypothetical protein